MLYFLIAATWMVALVLLYGSRHLMNLAQFEQLVPDRWPRLSVLVPACNEEETIEPALRSLLKSDYPELEIVVVEDRSTDRTGEVLETLAAEFPQLKVVRNRELPQGWLGKNHALWQARRRASGDLLLFTDADVVFEKHALRWAVQAMLNLNTDHLVVTPQMDNRTLGEKAMVSIFLLAFRLRFRPELVHYANRYYVGVGAFNMVRAKVYDDLGGHAIMPMEVADDLFLGKFIKFSGYRQACLLSDALRVRWVVGLRGLVAGIEKNAYSGVDFSPVQLVTGTLFMVTALSAPLALLLYDPVSHAAAALCFPAWMLMVKSADDPKAYPLWAGLLFPLTVVVLGYSIVRSGLLAHWRGGIYWRGTFYRLDELRRARAQLW